MQDTVDAVMAEQEDGILAEPPTLKERFAALFSRRDRRLSQDTEQLWVTEPLPQPEEELEPEPDSDDALRIERRAAIRLLEKEGIKAGLFRPITLWPFPEKRLHELAGADHVKAILDVEMSSTGQMLDDVRLGVEGQKPISYLGRAGGVIPTVEEIIEAAKKALKEVK